MGFRTSIRIGGHGPWATDATGQDPLTVSAHSDSAVHVVPGQLLPSTTDAMLLLPTRINLVDTEHVQ